MELELLQSKLSSESLMAQLANQSNQKDVIT